MIRYLTLTPVQPSSEERLQALEKENRILQKKLKRAQQDLKQVEATNESKETLLRNALQELRESQASLEERKQAIRDLLQAQSRLIHTEKMSSLGQLVAGIAHEINNPVNFIHGNLSHFYEYSKDLLDTIAVYRQYAIDFDENLLPIPLEDLDFITQDLMRMVESMRMGSLRIREIVQSLRSFSRLDEAEIKEVDIHSGIEDTLMILRYRLEANTDRPAIHVIKEYGDVGLIECCPGQLNQVFMNLISNAIDACDDLNRSREYCEIIDHPNEIRIHTYKLNQSFISVEICDNGIGIPEQVRNKLFDPFFTTKPVGQGTGLGLAISHEIVTKQHNGFIEIESQPGCGTTFRLKLPVRPHCTVDSNFVDS